MNEFMKITQELVSLLEEWEPKLLALSEEVITYILNEERWSIKETIGHLVDSASNNTHRIIHLQYQPSPLQYPDYANLGNNDKWVAIQNYQNENWYNLVQLWKYANFHLVHVINNVNEDKLDNEWINALNQRITLRAMIIDYLRHFKLHLGEIDELIKLQEKESGQSV